MSHFTRLLLTIGLASLTFVSGPASAQSPAGNDALAGAQGAPFTLAPIPALCPDLSPILPAVTNAVESSSQSGQSDDSLKKPIPQNPVPSGQPRQTKRILDIIPNFRSVSTDEKLPAMSVKEKFLTATDDSFDYSSIFIPAALAGYSMARKSTPEFGQGAVGYGRYFWHTAVDQTSENYMVEFVFPVITREDNRYYTLGRGGFLKRTGYALSRAVITRSDSGRETFNISEVVGAGASSGISSLYYPVRERSFSNTADEWGIDIGIDAASFVVKEFWPDINHRLFHRDVPSEGKSQPAVPAR